MKTEKFTERQKELFEEFEARREKKPLGALGDQPRKLSFFVSTDALLLVGILLLTAAIVVYAVGVEIGRRHHRMIPIVEDVEKKEAVTPLPSRPAVSLSQPSPTLKAKGGTSPSKGGYTIQVAHYRQSGPAQRTVEALRKKGYSAFLDTSSTGVSVCVGEFKKNSEAQTSLSELRKLYPDAFVRNR